MVLQRMHASHRLQCSVVEWRVVECDESTPGLALDQQTATKPQTMTQWPLSTQAPCREQQQMTEWALGLPLEWPRQQRESVEP
jgi:hypothetical protein